MRDALLNATFVGLTGTPIPTCAHVIAAMPAQRCS